MLRLRDSLPCESEGEVFQIDLQPRANQRLTEALHFPDGGGRNNLKQFPQGEQTFEGVKFRVGEALIHLAGKPYAPDKPEKVEGIPVNKAFAKLYIVHGTGYGGGPPSARYYVEDGTLIGKYQVHYEDKSVRTIPIVYGQDVRDWWNRDDSRQVTRGKVVWTGENDFSKDENIKIRVYFMSWDNPQPDLKVDTIDYISHSTPAAPFCIAMTAREK